MTKAVTLQAVERERERESYTLKTKSTALFNNLTHTSDLVKINKKYKGKDNVVLPCGFYDTG